MGANANQRGLKDTERKPLCTSFYLDITHTTMSSAAQTLLQVKAGGAGIMAIVLYSCC